MDAGDLVTAQAAQDWVGSTVSADLISSASAQIERYLGFKVASATYTRTLDGTGRDLIVVPDRPLTAVSSLTISGVPVGFSAGVPAPGYQFDDRALYMIGGVFTRGRRNVVVTYTAGYATIPDDIAQACLVLLKTVSERSDRESDVTSEKAGDSAITYSQGRVSSAAAAQLARNPPLPSDVLVLLANYRRVAPC